MPRIYWYAIAAAVGLTVCTASPHAQTTGADQKSQSAPTEYVQSSTENSEPQQRPSIHDLIERIATALDAQDSKEEAQWEREQTARDLQAQEKMATWAIVMAAITGLGVLVTGVGVVLVYFTLRYTRDAAKHAESAAKAAWETVQEAKSATTTTQRAAADVAKNTRRELRAYISVKPDGIIKQTGTPEALGHVRVINVGKLPARKVFVHVRMGRGPRDTDDFPIPEHTDNVRRTIQPGADMDQGSQDSLHAVDFDPPQGFVFVWGVVYYQDGFGEPRKTRFCHRYNLEALGDNERFFLFDPASSLIAGPNARYNEIGNDAD